MHSIRPHLHVVCMVRASSAASVLLPARTPRKRLALPNSRVMIHQPSIQGGFGQASDIEIQANEIVRIRECLENTLAHHTKRNAEEIRADIERDKIRSEEHTSELQSHDQLVGRLLIEKKKD